MVEVAEEAYRQAVASGSLVEQLEQTVAQLANLSGELEKDRVSFVISLPSHLPLLHPSIAMTVLQTSQTSRFIDSSRSTTSAIHRSLLTQLTSLRDNASAAVGTVNETGINTAIARAILVSTNSTLTSKPLQLPDYKTSFTGSTCSYPTGADVKKDIPSNGGGREGGKRGRVERTSV